MCDLITHPRHNFVGGAIKLNRLCRWGHGLVITPRVYVDVITNQSVSIDATAICQIFLIKSCAKDAAVSPVQYKQDHGVGFWFDP